MNVSEHFPKRLATHLSYILLVVVLTVVAIVRIRLLDVPLERDEGEFAYMGQLLLKGIPPFAHAYTMKLPGVSVAYALFMFLFGLSPAGIHLGLLIVNAICIVLIYLLAQRLYDRKGALIACASYAILSISFSVSGVFAHATHFVMLFALAGFIFLFHYLEKMNIALLLLSGLCFGVAFTMKQHAVLFIVFALLYLVRHNIIKSIPCHKRLLAESTLFLIGVIIPYILIIIWMAQTGVFKEFWFWTIQYAREYASGQTHNNGLENLRLHSFSIMTAQLPLWLIAISGCIFLFTKYKCCTDKFFLLGFFLFSFLSICPGFHFRDHYYIMLLPAVALLIGAAVSAAERLLSPLRGGNYLQIIPTLLLMASITYGIYHEKKSLFTLTPSQISRAIYGESPFPEALNIARYIKGHTSPDDRIVVLGSEPEIYFYADRLSATGHIYMYGLMENQPYAKHMQMQLIRDIELTKPKYLVFTNVNYSWMIQESSPTLVFEWYEKYVKEYYERVGVIDILSVSATRYLWDNNSTDYVPPARTYGDIPDSKSYLFVFKRKEFDKI